MSHMRRQTRGWRMNRRVGGQAGRRVVDAVTRLGLLVMLLLTAYPPTRLPAQNLQRRLDKRLDAAPFDRNLWGIVVIDERGRTVYARNADKLFIPASNT